MIPRALTTISILYKRALLVFYAEEPDAKFRVMMMMMMVMVMIEDDDVLSEAGRPTGITVLSVLWNRCLGTTEGGGSEGEVGILGLGAHFSMSLSISLTSFVQ